MTGSWHRKLAVAWLLGIHLAALFAGTLAPYDPTEQRRSMPFEAPTGWTSRDPAAPIFVLGSDQFGRDQFSRLLFALRHSLAAAIAAAMLALALGTLAGVVAGWAGGWTDVLFMRLTELFVSLPWLYLLLAGRAFLPLDAPPIHALLLFVVLAGAIGWARPARLVRGVVLSAKEREYVQAARGFGGKPVYLMRTHVLPQLRPLLWTQGALTIPKYMLAETTLSFLGLGIGEPVPSLGGLLANLQQYHMLTSYWWMYLPAIVMITACAAWQAVSHQSKMEIAG